jgi:predicted nucleic acid-binding protein
MNGDKILLDTNTVLYVLGGKLQLSSLPAGTYHISFITELELLSYCGTNQDEKPIKEFIDTVTVIDIPKEIKTQTITLRKKYKLKLPDAIICGTALVINAIFISGDKRLHKIKELRLPEKA